MPVTRCFQDGVVIFPSVFQPQIRTLHSPELDRLAFSWSRRHGHGIDLILIQLIMEFQIDIDKTAPGLRTVGDGLSASIREWHREKKQLKARPSSGSFGRAD